MKTEKKQVMQEKQKNIAILYRNRKLIRINLLVLSSGLALSYLEYEIGEPLLWLGIIIFVYTLVTNYIARSALKKL
jgi:putative Mn2+ efflux pump MntP